MSLDEKRLHRTVRDQDGAITLSQALACGYSHTTVRRKVAAGEWSRLANRVYLVGSHRRTPTVLVRAARLSLGGDAVLVGPAAAWWHGLIDRCPDVIDVAVPPRRQHRTRPGVRVVRRAGPRAASDLNRAVRVTTVPHTVLDAAAALGLVEGARVMDRALQRRAVALPPPGTGRRDPLTTTGSAGGRSPARPRGGRRGLGGRATRAREDEG